MTNLANMTVSDLLTQIAAKVPAPGGGAAVCINAALGVALAQMAIAYSLGKKDLARFHDELTEAQAQLLRARAVLLELGDEDAAAYRLVNELQRLPETDPRRVAELEAATLAAANVPLAAMAACVDVLRVMDKLPGKLNTRLISDFVIGAVTIEAACRCSAMNVSVNLAEFADQEQAETLEAQSDTMLDSASELVSTIGDACAEVAE